MILGYNIRERHFRIIMVILLGMIFIKLNWGASLDAINHIILTARSNGFTAINDEIAAAIGNSIVPFGRSVSNLVIVCFIWHIFNHILKSMDVDATHFEEEWSRLKNENALLYRDLDEANQTFFKVLQNLTELCAHNSQLERHKDRVVELRVELEKLSLKEARKSQAAKDISAVPSAPDLFQSPERPIPVKKRRRFRVKSNALQPKF